MRSTWFVMIRRRVSNPGPARSDQHWQVEVEVWRHSGWQARKHSLSHSVPGASGSAAHKNQHRISGST
eukprot:2430068-Rhodomonas_salina.2